MRGKAICHGAATIVSAIATGRGAAFGIDLHTEAEVELVYDEGVTVEMDVDEDASLVIRCVRDVLARYAAERRMGARVTTRSNIPVSRGLKSSSAAANAVIFATLDALGISVDPLDAIRMGTRAAREVGVSVTGAFDDACASHFGGVVLTDNRSEEILKRDTLPDGLVVLIHVPERQIRKSDLPLDRMRAMGSMVEIAFSLAEKGDYFDAMTLNGIAYSAALGLDPSLAVDALSGGALAAGLSGTGPATAILVSEAQADELRKAIGGEVIATRPHGGGGR